MRRTFTALLQAGVHVPKSGGYHAAKMKHWPAQSIPESFNFTAEQRFHLKAMPRDTGRIPRDFVLSVLYQHQPCEVDKLWDFCAADSACVLDCKRHLRDVLKQAREEGFVTFEESISEGRSTWRCLLTRERYEDVKRMIATRTDAAAAATSGLRGNAIPETTSFLDTFRGKNQNAKEEHVRLLREQVQQTTDKLRRFQRMEVDYLPYTDLNGKVQFMWWYETRDQANRANETLPSTDDNSATVAAVASDAEKQL